MHPSLSVETSSAIAKNVSEQVVQTKYGAFEMPDEGYKVHSGLSKQATEIAGLDVTSIPSVPKVLAIKVFYGNEYCIFRVNSDTSLKQLLAEASEFWNVPFLQYTFVDENDWVVTLWENAATLLRKTRKDTTRLESNEESRNVSSSSSEEYIHLWLVEKDKKKKNTYQDNTNNTNFRFSSFKTSFVSNYFKSKETTQVSPIFRFPTEEDLPVASFAKKDGEPKSGDEESPAIHLLDKNQQSQTGEVAKLLVSLYPQNKDSDSFEGTAARTDSTFNRTSLPRAAVVEHPTQKYTVSPSLKSQVESLLITENDKALCHICGKHDLKKPWLIRCRIADCGMLYHPDCVRWIPSDAASSNVHDGEQFLRLLLNDLCLWKCPKHQCSECGVESDPLACCTLCTTSYCSKHVPPSVRPYQMSPHDWHENLETKFRKIICDVCVGKETKRDPATVSGEKMNVDQSFPTAVCTFNVATTLLPRVEPKAIEFPWFATHFMELNREEAEMSMTKYQSFQRLEASSDSTIGYSEKAPKNTEASSVAKRPYVRRISPDSLKRNDFEFRLNDGSSVKLGPLLNMKLTDDDVAAGLSNNRVLQAAFIILRDEKKPLDAKALAERASERGFHCLSLMPNNTFSSQIYRNMKRKKEHSAFYKVNNGEFGLKIWLREEANAKMEDGETNKKTYQGTVSDQVEGS